MGHLGTKFLAEGEETDGLPIQHHLGLDAAIDVHLVVRLPGGRHLDIHRIEGWMR